MNADNTPTVSADAPSRARVLVIDTNVALDLLLFQDPATAPLRQALASGHWRWISTDGMRAELARVLQYPQIAPRLLHHGLSADVVLARFDDLTQRVAPSPKAPCTCRDADDQPFVDLAVAHRAPLFSKDRDLRQMRKRLAGCGVWVGPLWPTDERVLG